MAFHKTEYEQNARQVGLRSYFIGRDEDEFNLDLDNVFLSERDSYSKYNAAQKFKVVFHTGYIFSNIEDFIKENNSDRLRSLFEINNPMSTNLVKRADDLFFIRIKYPNLNQLQKYYYEYCQDDVDFLNELFFRMFDRVVKRCGETYKAAFLRA